MQPTEINNLLQHVNHTNKEELEQQLQAAINYLIINDFEKLVQLLYTIDVDEKRLKTLLHQKRDVDAAKTITGLLIARQLQKIEWRQQHSNKGDDDDNEEKW